MNDIVRILVIVLLVFLLGFIYGTAMGEEILGTIFNEDEPEPQKVDECYIGNIPTSNLNNQKVYKYINS